MSDAGKHPRVKLDPVIHTPVRLSITAILARSEEVDFRFLGDTVDVSDSLLSKHLATLENAGYISIRRTHVGRIARTWIALTASGREAFAVYQRALADIVGSMQPQ